MVLVFERVKVGSQNSSQEVAQKQDVAHQWVDVSPSFSFGRKGSRWREVKRTSSVDGSFHLCCENAALLRSQADPAEL